MSDFKEITAVVIKSHKSDFPDPLILKKGERLKVGTKKTNFAGWFWCSTPDGKSGWIPEIFTEKIADGCRMIVDYDATEMSVAVGENLTILSEESEWAWCRNSKNLKGWVPLENVRKLR